jgi:hypothetical protein
MNHLNFITAVALLSWPLVAFWLYSTRPVAQATLWTILGGYLLLPVGAEIKFPSIPALDKDSAAGLAALIGCWMYARKPLQLWQGFGFPELLMITLFVSLFITSTLNGDALVYGSLVLPGVGPYDGGSAIIAQLVTFIPFFLGRRVLRNGADNEEILRVLIIAGLIYSLPLLFEIRMSPQLHRWIYGYAPGQFVQELRDEGFRAVIFLGNGLLVAFFMLTTVVAAAAFWRTGTPVRRGTRLPAAGITAYLGVVLVLCKTLSDVIYAAVLLPLVRFATPKMQAKIALVLVSVALLYPTLRVMDLIPTDTALSFAASVSAERANSLKVRFTNEDHLLQHESQRFWFGWGRFGRNRIYDPSGKDVSLTDGTWIITMGQFGFIGFAAIFGLLAYPVFRAASAFKYAASNNAKVFLAAVTLILAINIFDLLPNSPLRPWTWLLAGALLGQAEALQAFARQQRGLWKSTAPVPSAQREPSDAPSLTSDVRSYPTQQ